VTRSRKQHEAQRREIELAWRRESLARRKEHETKKLAKRFGLTDRQLARFLAAAPDNTDPSQQDEIDLSQIEDISAADDTDTNTIPANRRLTVIHKHERELPAKQDSSPWVGVAVGLGVFAVVTIAGVVVYLMLSRKRDHHNALGDGMQMLPAPPPQIIMPQQAAPQIYMVNPQNPQVPSSLEAAIRALTQAQSGRLPREPVMMTLRLPPMGDPNYEQVRICSATDVPYEVELRVVGPAGTYAIFTTVPGYLDRDFSNIPTGDSLIVQSGASHRLRLNPKQAVFGKGSAPNVIVSATAAEAVERVYT
jgi:hypothetical protein